MDEINFENEEFPQLSRSRDLNPDLGLCHVTYPRVSSLTFAYSPQHMTWSKVRVKVTRPWKLGKVFVFRIYLLHFQWQLASDCCFLNCNTISKFCCVGFSISILVFVWWLWIGKKIHTWPTMRSRPSVLHMANFCLLLLLVKQKPSMYLLIDRWMTVCWEMETAWPSRSSSLQVRWKILIRRTWTCLPVRSQTSMLRRTMLITARCE